MKTCCLVLMIFFQIAMIGQISVTALPETIFIEKSRTSQLLNFDFLIVNTSADTILLESVRVKAYDAKENLLQMKFLDNNGTAPSIRLLPIRQWDGPESHLLFNPFAEFNASIPISKLQYEWVFEGPKENQMIVTTQVQVHPHIQKQEYSLPLSGRILVYDAHDYQSHHRRFDYHFTPIRALGLRSNFMRFAYDFVHVDDKGEKGPANAKGATDALSFGKPVRSVAAGKVIYVAGDHPDDGSFNVPKLKDNPMELYGNCIAIEHDPGIVSVYGHLKQGSLKVRKGDLVKAGQEIAAIGNSGSSFFPHLHFEMRTSLLHDAQGIPSYFGNLKIAEGPATFPVEHYAPETGVILVAE